MSLYIRIYITYGDVVLLNIMSEAWNEINVKKLNTTHFDENTIYSSGVNRNFH